MICGWRVLWLVAAVAMRMRSVTAPAAPETVAASLYARRSEMNPKPRPISSAVRISSTTARVEGGAPANV